MRFGLSQQNLETLNLLAIRPLRSHGAQVWIFGSRARGTHRPFSDIDLLYELPEGKNLPSGFLFEIKSQLEESRLPYKVDLVDLRRVALSYRPGILKDRIELNESK